MAGIIYSGDWLQHHTKMISEGFKVDRIITDIPSFDGRWNGANGVQGIGTIRDLVSATVRAGEKMIDNPDGTMTISCTGIAQEKYERSIFLCTTAGTEKTSWQGLAKV